MSQHILLTGGTGAIGSAVLAQLLDEPDVRVSVLLRAKDARDLADRGRKLLEFCSACDGDEASRVEFVAGDVCAERLGLSGVDAERVARQCTGVIHSAGNVKLNHSLEEARRHAVTAVEEVLAFARRAPRLEKVDIVSTIGVGGRMGSVPERRLTEPRSFNNTYEQAKAEAEELCWQAAGEGLPLTVHRPSMVVGDSRNGAIPHFQVFYYLCEFLTGNYSFGLLPDFGEAGLDIVPADFVARAICSSACGRTDAGRALHLCSGDRPELRVKALAPSIRSIYEQQGRTCRPPRVLSRPMFGRLVNAAAWLGRGRLRKSAHSLQFFLPYLEAAQRFEVEETHANLAERSIEAPAPADYLPAVLGAYLQRQTRTVPRRCSVTY
jgi:nucleoside-diphosphate-sugar epimerase